MNLKKYLSVLALGAAVFSAGASAETIKVGTHPTFAPFEFSDSEGQIIGFDLDIIKAIGKANGDTIVIESMPFDGLIPSLITGNLDAIISGMTITEERKKRVDFSEGYYGSNLSMLILQSKTEEYKTAKDLAGKAICVQIGTTGHAFAKTVSPDNIKALNNQPDAMLELKNGGCEAVINDRPVNLFYMNKDKQKVFADVVDPVFTEKVDEFGIAVRKGEKELLDRLNSGYNKIRESGELDAIFIKWFGVDSKGNAPVAEAEVVEEAAE